MNNYKILDVADEVVLLKKWYNAISTSEAHSSNLIKNEFEKLKNLHIPQLDKTKKTISKFEKLHAAARLIDSDFNNFNTPGTFTLFLEENYFKPFSLSKVSVDIRPYSLDTLMEISEKLVHAKTRDTNIEVSNKNSSNTPKYRHLSDFIKRQDQFLSYALLKIAETKNVNQYNALKTLIGEQKLSPDFFINYLAKRAEFGADLVKYEQKLAAINQDIKLPELSVRRFVKEQYSQEALKNQ